MGTICAKTAQVLGHSFASIAITPADRAPDHARTVLVHTHGSVATAPVTDGLFVLRDAVGMTSDFFTLR